MLRFGGGRGGGDMTHRLPDGWVAGARVRPQGCAGRLRPLAQSLAAAVAQAFQKGRAGDENAVAGAKLVVGGGVAGLNDLVVADGHDDAAAVFRRRPAEDDVCVGSPRVQPPGGDDAVQNRLPALEPEGSWRVHLP